MAPPHEQPRDIDVKPDTENFNPLQSKFDFHRGYKIFQILLQIFIRPRPEAPPVAKWHTVEYAALPDWLQCNEYLHRGHRPAALPLLACIKSVFSFHTETLNIWTQLGPFIAVSLYASSVFCDPEISSTDKLGLAPYLLGLIICFGLSTFYHTVHCHSAVMYTISCTCDYLGIIIAVSGIALSVLFYLWWCRLYFLIIYFLIYAIAGLCSAYFIFRGEFFHEDTKEYRGILGVFLAFLILFSILHEMMLSGFWESLHHYPLVWASSGTGLVTIGIFFYVNKIPESIWPGKFDIWFHSHQIFHVFILFGAYCGYKAVLQMAQYRANHIESHNCTNNYTLINPYDVFF